MTASSEPEGVPVRRSHDLGDQHDVLIWNILVKQVTHRIDEDNLLLRPGEWLRQLVRHQSQVEALLVRMSRHTTKSFSERLGIAMGAPGADLRAAPNRAALLT